MNHHRHGTYLVLAIIGVILLLFFVKQTAQAYRWRRPCIPS